jgi:hypothetical protein
MNKGISFWSRIDSLRLMASVFGALAGISNIQFGIIELLKGNVKPDNFMFISYNQPALSIIPNYFITGILGVVFGLLFVIWSIFFVQIKRGGLIMNIIAVIQMLFGASMIRIPQEIIFGLIGTRINKPLKWWDKVLPSKSLNILSKLWPWSFILYIICYIVHLATGEIESLFGGNNQVLNTVLMIVPAYGNLILFVLTVVTGFAHKLNRNIL